MSAEKLKPKLIKKAQPQVNESKFEENWLKRGRWGLRSDGPSSTTARDRKEGWGGVAVKVWDWSHRVTAQQARSDKSRREEPEAPMRDAEEGR
jgi:hypothetical protein